MSGLEIHLQAGFQHDTVVVWADGGEVGEILAARTHPASGLAGVLRETRPPRCVRLQIVIPNRRLRRAVDLHPAVTPFVGVSVDGNRIHVHLSRHAFRYPHAAPSRPCRLAPASRAVIRCPRRTAMHDTPRH